MSFINFLKANGVSVKEESLLQSETKKIRNTIISSHNNKPSELTRCLQKGCMIKVIKYKNSPYNIYKGYIGEIMDYKRDMDTALVFLHALNSFNLIKLPLQHFIII
uniref:KOW domain-containing protein n=1 Tax=viral metagenome TaxID=1070528 RepID=A0A6C0E0X8_9ZZZZ